MKYKKFMLLICIIFSVLCTLSCAFANDAMNETISTDNSDIQDLQINYDDVNNTLKDSNTLSTPVVYFDASAASDGDGSQLKPYKYYKSDRIEYGATAYFADGEYTINEANSIYSSSKYRTTFIGQSMDKTILKSDLTNKFDFTVTDNSYLVLNNMTLIGVHINNQANLIANDVLFRDSVGFNPDYPPSLSYSHISKIYDGSYGGVIICDTPSNKQTTLNFTDCYFKNNYASSGGVIATYNTIANIQNCIFYNSSAERFGGVIYSIKSSFNIKNSNFGLNYAKYAGAIYSNSSEFNLKDSEFNLSQAYSFGGVIASFSSQFDINHVNFNDYASLSDAGGSIYAIGGTLNVADSSFKNGSSDFGGAICSLKCDSVISGSQFINNSATYYGGSVYNMYGSIELAGNIFENSYALIGGSIFNRLSDSLKLSNNKFTSSKANDGEIVFVDGKADVTQTGNVYDTSKEFIKNGNIYDVDYHMSVPIITSSSQTPDTMPSSYDSRKYGYITPVKDQIQGGNCWAFSGIATLEACLKKATGIEYDFSEENVKNLMSDYSIFDLNSGANNGGNLYMFIAYLAGWFGPTYDENDIYDDYSSISKLYDSIVHVQNVYILPDRESFYDNDKIKMAVMQYGAVAIGIDLSRNQGHAVTIVGWDDEFTGNDFLGNKAVGAWIIKNSWGSNWGFDGFGYLSYLQPVSFPYTFIFNDDRGYSNVYQYDYAGKSSVSYQISSNQVYLKNKFTAKNDEILSAISTYFEEPSNFTAYIYLNGNLVATQDGFSEMGYYTIPLAEEIPLKKGDNFEVVVKFSNEAPVKIPLSTVSGLNKINFAKGISYYSVDGVKWLDLYDEANIQGIACIKAFTRLQTLTGVSIDYDESGGTNSNSFGNVHIGDLINIQLDLPQYYVVDGIQHSLDGLVTFTINGQEYFATIENGKACLNISFEKEGVYDVKAQVKSSRVISDIFNMTVNVVKTADSNLVIQAKDVSKFYGGSEKYVATVYNGDAVLSGVNVKISVNGKDYTVKTDNNGQVILDFDLPVGEYDVVAQYGGKIASSKFTVLTTIIAHDSTFDFLDSYISASFIDTEGKALSNTPISFTVTIYGVNSIPSVFNATTNNFGEATTDKINLFADKYLVSVVNPVTKEKKEFVLEVLQIDSECSLTVTQSGSNNVIIDATLNSPYAYSEYSKSYVNFLVLGKVYREEVKLAKVDGGDVALARLILSNLAIGDYNVDAIFSGNDNFRVSTDSMEFSVTDNPYVLYSGNFWGYYGLSGTQVWLFDKNNNPIDGEVVYATIANQTYGSITKNGIAQFRLNLDVGDYPVLFKYKGQSLLKYVSVYSTIMNVTSSTEYLNSKIGAYLIDPYHSDKPNDYSNLNFTVNGQVKFIVDGKEYITTTDSNGYASVDVDLPVGTYNVTIVNMVTGEKKQSKITVYKTTPTVTLTKSKRGNIILFTATVSHAFAVGNVVFTMGSNKYTSIIIDGKSVLALGSIEEGSYDIYANYIGDTNFNNILSDTMKFDYEKTNYTLSAPKLSKYYGGSAFNVTLTNFNKPVSNALINITVNDKVYTIKTDSNGVASWNVQLDPGSYVVECNFEDMEPVYSGIEVNSTITDLSSVAGVSDSILKIEFRNGNGDLIKNKLVTFKIDSKEYKNTTDASGIATLNTDLENYGNYNVTIINPVTGEIKYSTLRITKITPAISFSVVKDKGIFEVKLPKTATGSISFILDDGGEYSAEINDGIVIFDDLDPGKYNGIVYYKGNDVLKPVSKSISFDIVISSVLSSSKVTTTYGTSKKIVVKLVDSKGDILYGRTITVNLNNKNYNAQIQGNGKAEIAIPTSLAVKIYTATIKYAGDSTVLGSTIKINVVVNKATPKITASKKTFKVKDKTKKYVVTLKTDKNKVYKNQKVTIKVNGKTYSAKTNSKGQAIFKLKKLTKKGTFKATIKYVGNSYYKALVKTVTIYVKK